MITIHRLFAIAVFSLATTTLNAQGSKKDVFFKDLSYKDRNSGSYGKSFSILSFGYGFGMDLPTYNSGDFTSSDNFYKDYDNLKHIGPFYVKYEHAIAEEFGVGVYSSYTRFEYKYDNQYASFDEHVFNGGAMAFYHFNKLINAPSTDFYVGAGLGYSIMIMAMDYSNNYGYGTDTYEGYAVVPAIRAGIRQYLGGNFGIYGEVGTDKACIANFGISINMGRTNPGQKTKHSKQPENEEEETNPDEEGAPSKEKKKTDAEDY